MDKLIPVSFALSRRQMFRATLASLPAIRLLNAQAPQTATPQTPVQQTAPQTPTFSSNVKVVNVLATVHDKQGQIVRNLTKDDFILEEDSRPQVIRYFSQQSDLPLLVGLLIDTSGSERRMIGTEKDASYTFLEHVLRPAKDRAFLIHFDREVELLQDLTSSREKLESALDQLNRPQFGSGGNSSGNNDPNSGNNNGRYGGGGGYGGGGYGGQRGGRRGGGGMGGGTTLYDALYLASNEVLKKEGGRKAVIMLTDGEDTGSKVSLGEAVTAAQRSDTLAYAVRIADEEQRPMSGFGGPGMGRHGGWGGQRGGGPMGGSQNRPDGKKILQQIARETGGGYFEVSKKKTVDQIYSQIEEELRNQYSLGYTSDRPDADGSYRRISLTVKQKGLIVQARDGYYAGAGA